MTNPPQAPRPSMSITKSPKPNSSVSPAELAAALEAALPRIPPLWPLRHFVAVNPFVGLVNQPFHAACALLQRSVGAAPLQSPADYRRAFDEGRIAAADLAAAGDSEWTSAALLKALDEAVAEPIPAPLPTVADWLDQSRPSYR